MAKKPSHQTARDYEQLGRLIENTYLTGALDRKRLIANNIIRGISTGIGTVIGITIAIALLLWILSLFSEIPLLGPVFESLKNSVNK